MKVLPPPVGTTIWPTLCSCITAKARCWCGRSENIDCLTLFVEYTITPLNPKVKRWWTLHLLSFLITLCQSCGKINTQTWCMWFLACWATSSGLQYSRMHIVMYSCEMKLTYPEWPFHSIISPWIQSVTKTWFSCIFILRDGWLIVRVTIRMIRNLPF